MVDSRNKHLTDPVVQAVAACLARHTRHSQSVVVGFSGGLDSTVLLHATSGLVDELRFDLAALHVHHGLSTNADTWVKFCDQVCQKMGISLAIHRVNVPQGTGEGVEAAARRVRHRALAEHPADWILLAHHADDQAETLLHNLLRGAGVRGAAAMPEARERILRPLLGLTREELSAYAQRHRLAWIEDESNDDNRYTRNFLRREVLPVIAARFPKANQNLAAAAARFGEAETLLGELATLDLRGAQPDFPLPLSLFRDLPEARSRNLLRAMLHWHQLQPPEEGRLREFVRQLRSAGGGRHPRIDLKNYSLWCRFGMLELGKKDKAPCLDANRQSSEEN